MSFQSTASKVAECQRAYEDGKLTDEELQQVEIIILLILMEEFVSLVTVVLVWYYPQLSNLIN